MKVIIPLAGKGTRLRPHTHITPKPMLKVAGKPVMDYVMDDLQKLGNVEQVVYITGHLKEKVEAVRARRRTRFPAVFIEQEVQDGTAGAVALARPYVDQPVLIIFVDTIFDADLSVVNTHRRRRHHLGEGGRGLPALRRRRHRRRRQHDEDRREAEGRRSRSARTSACTTSATGSCCTRASTTCSSSRRTRASTTSPTRSST